MPIKPKRRAARSAQEAKEGIRVCENWEDLIGASLAHGFRSLCQQEKGECEEEKGTTRGARLPSKCIVRFLFWNSSLVMTKRFLFIQRSQNASFLPPLLLSCPKRTKTAEGATPGRLADFNALCPPPALPLPRARLFQNRRARRLLLAARCYSCSTIDANSCADDFQASSSYGTRLLSTYNRPEKQRARSTTSQCHSSPHSIHHHLAAVVDAEEDDEEEEEGMKKEKKLRLEGED